METINLSVIMPNRNHARHLPRSISSVLNQTLRPREFIILDDGSTDDSLQVIERFAARDPVIRVVRSEHNHGVVDRLNFGTSLAAGDYILYASADDDVAPELIEKTMALFECYPDAGLSCGFVNHMNVATGESGPNPLGWCDRPSYLLPAQLSRCLGRTWIPSNAAVFKRSAIVGAGGFLPELRWLSDWFLNLCIAFRGGVCHVPEPLATWHFDPDSYSVRGFQNPQAHGEALAAVLNHLNSPTYADVAPWFALSGIVGVLGPEVIRAAAAHPDRWNPPIFAVLNSLPREHYEQLADDPDERVRELATFFLVPCWRADNTLVRLQEQLARSQRQAAQTQSLIADMRSSKFWKIREIAVRWKNAIPLLRRRTA